MPALSLSCGSDDPDGTVVVYTSVDQVFSEPVLKEFEAKTGIRVLPAYDVEAAKTTGLVNRLIAEKDRPRADVFWNGEFAQTILLKKEGLLDQYISPNAADGSLPYRDPEGYWTGFAGRARVFIVNTDLVAPSDYPSSVFDLLEPRWPADKLGIAHPVFGTTATHAAALYATLDPAEGRAFFERIRDRGVRVVDGNSVVRDMVASGQLMFGLTDTDDACGAIERGSPVAIVFPDQNDMGTLIVPNTVALVVGAPHPDQARMLIDYLLTVEVEEMLAGSGWSHVSPRAADAQPECLGGVDPKGMAVGLQDVFDQIEAAKKEMGEVFIR